MATIEPRGRKWRVRIRKAGYPVLTKTLTDKREARIWAERTELAIDRGEWVADDHDAAISAKRLTLSEALDLFYDEYIERKREDPRPEYLRIQRLKKTQLAKYTLSTLRSKTLSQYVTSRLKAVGPDTVRLDLALLRLA